MTPGEIGCSLSHLRIYDCFDSWAGPALVLEGDAFPRAHCLPLHIASLAQKISPDCVAILGCQDGLFTSRFFEPGYLYRLRRGWPIARTAAYLIGKQAAKRMGKFQHKHLLRADDWRIFSQEDVCRLLYIDLFGHPVDPNPVMEEQRSSLDCFNWRSATLSDVSSRFFDKMISLRSRLAPRTYYISRESLY
mgnify:CR=1 FL=1